MCAIFSPIEVPWLLNRIVRIELLKGNSKVCFEVKKNHFDTVLGPIKLKWLSSSIDCT